MDKKTIKNLMIAACSSLVACTLSAEEAPITNSKADPAYGNMNYKLMTEDDLLLELNADGQKLYMSLDPEGKSLARKIASQRCGGTNDCKGLNACATDKNTCAGQGSCKGQTKCGMSDKNLAVKIASEAMAKKRVGLLKH